MSSVDVLATVYAAANSTHRKYRSFIDLDDLQQEAYLWMLDHQPAIKRHLEADSAKVAEYRILRDCSMHLEKAARAAKASTSGYEPDDEQWYSTAVLALVLPKVLTGDRTPPSVVTDGTPRAQTDPAEGGTWMALFADVSKALKALGTEDVHLLVDRYVEDLSFDAIASRWQWASSRTAHQKVGKAEARLIEALGGFKPKGCQEIGCEHLEHGSELRRRPTGREETW
jgi:hypothetical protein